MKRNIISTPSFWGTELRQKHILTREGNNKLAVLFPGRNYPCELPLLHYAGNSAVQYGFDVLILEYGYQAARTNFDGENLPNLVEECLEAVNRISSDYDQIIFVSKSMGTVVAGEVHRRLQLQINHIFLTPLAGTLPFINTSNRIVVYGSNDPMFGAKELGQIEDQQGVFEIPNADHGLETGNVEEDLSVLNTIVKTYKDVFEDK